ncbi:MAG: hypothetical protein IEMM0002_0841 [bacterium]|nr:MAG: hypothetical protein IEMM0002_0841 [bacterium]
MSEFIGIAVGIVLLIIFLIIVLIKNLETAVGILILIVLLTAVLFSNFGIAVGIVALYLDLILGFSFVGLLLRRAGLKKKKEKKEKTKEESPENIHEAWEEIPENIRKALEPPGIGEAGKWLGILERLVSFMAVWTGGYTLIPAWLALKVAAKWQVFSNVIKVPEQFPGESKLDSLRYRRIWGSRALMGFLIGTLANVLLGGVAAYIGKNAPHAWDVIEVFCSKLLPTGV